MFNLGKILKIFLYLLLLAIVSDCSSRAFTDEGLIEKISPKYKILLKKIGLLNLKDIHQFNQLHQSAETLVKDYLKNQTELSQNILNSIKNHNVSSMEILIEKANSISTEYLRKLDQFPNQMKEIVTVKGYVVNTSNNLKVAGIILAFLIIRFLFYLNKRGKVAGGTFKKPVLSLKDLAGIYVSTNIHSDYRYHSTDNPFDIGSERAGEAKRSFENSKLKEEISIKRGDEVQICYLVPGEAEFEVFVPETKPIKKTVGKNKFFVGLKDKTFNQPGEYTVNITIGSKTYSARIVVE
jgi:hypothetical protein